MVKIGIYMPTASYLIGGAETVAIQQARFLARSGLSVVFIALGGLKETDEYIRLKEEESIVFVELSKGKMSSEVIENTLLDHDVFHEMYYCLGSQISAECAKEGITHMISHYTLAPIFVPNHVKNILILHGTPTKICHLDQIGVEMADQLLAVSHSVKKGWEDLLRKSIDISVVHNGIDIDQYAPTVEPITEEIDLFFVGRLVEIKGVQYLLDAIKFLEETYDVVLNVYLGGSGPYKQEIDKKLVSLGIASEVRFVGYIPQGELKSYYQRSKICVFPSYEKEGVLTTMLEAAACGKAIITCDCCGMVDFLEHKQNGLLCRPKDGIDLGNKIYSLLFDIEERERLGLNARSNVEYGWSWESSVERLKDFIFK